MPDNTATTLTTNQAALITAIGTIPAADLPAALTAAGLTKTVIDKLALLPDNTATTLTTNQAALITAIGKIPVADLPTALATAGIDAGVVGKLKKLPADTDAVMPTKKELADTASAITTAITGIGKFPGKF